MQPTHVLLPISADNVARLAAWAVVTASAQQNLPDKKVLVLEGSPALQMDSLVPVSTPVENSP